MIYEIVNTHIDNIRAGDTVVFEDKVRTVCNSDISRSEFFGVTLFGNSYNIGTKPVKRVVFFSPKHK